MSVTIVNGLTNESIPEICKTETNQNKSFLNILPKPYILVSKKVNVLDKSYQIQCQYETTQADPWSLYLLNSK